MPAAEASETAGHRDLSALKSMLVTNQLPYVRVQKNDDCPRVTPAGSRSSVFHTAFEVRCTLRARV